VLSPIIEAEIAESSAMTFKALNYFLERANIAGEEFMLTVTRRYCTKNFGSWFFITAILFGSHVFLAEAHAETIVALGASNAAGYGVGSGQAWPAQVESMLRAKGYDVTVNVNAVSGDTSAGILSRVSSVPQGTRAVMFEPGFANDRRKGVSQSQTASNFAQIRSQIRVSGATPLMINFSGAPLQADGVHFSPAGHELVAARFVSQLTGILRKQN
jgi:acyl-CoA thioesterase I